ncbi:transposase [Paraburkholderia panacisoli]|uniref:Transposase n=1 Tax=Paraburkholderia panacisoli TaxID=2603818 RepID=A0A5B0GUK1_9BURK|nr:transposase [Paraburkholderia panacisoli]
MRSSPSIFSRKHRYPIEPEWRRRDSVEEKLAIARERFTSAATASGVARRHGGNANQVFTWRKPCQEDRLIAWRVGESAVWTSQLAAPMKKVKELRR